MIYGAYWDRDQKSRFDHHHGRQQSATNDCNQPADPIPRARQFDQDQEEENAQRGAGHLQPRAREEQGLV
jgi:hypothetical protein